MERWKAYQETSWRVAPSGWPYAPSLWGIHPVCEACARRRKEES